MCVCVHLCARTCIFTNLPHTQQSKQCAWCVLCLQKSPLPDSLLSWDEIKSDMNNQIKSLTNSLKFNSHYFHYDIHNLQTLLNNKSFFMFLGTEENTLNQNLSLLIRCSVCHELQMLMKIFQQWNLSHRQKWTHRYNYIMWLLDSCVTLRIMQGGMTPSQSGITEGVDRALPLLISTEKLKHTHLNSSFSWCLMSWSMVASGWGITVLS